MGTQRADSPVPLRLSVRRSGPPPEPHDPHNEQPISILDGSLRLRERRTIQLRLVLRRVEANAAGLRRVRREERERRRLEGRAAVKLLDEYEFDAQLVPDEVAVFCPQCWSRGFSDGAARKRLPRTFAVPPPRAWCRSRSAGVSPLEGESKRRNASVFSVLPTALPQSVVFPSLDRSTLPTFLGDTSALTVFIEGILDHCAAARSWESARNLRPKRSTASARRTTRFPRRPC